MSGYSSSSSGSGDEEYKCLSTPEMTSMFAKPYYLDQEEAITLRKDYILYLSAVNLGSETRLGMGLSNFKTCIYSMGSSLRCTNTLPAESSPIISVRFAPDNPSLLYVGCRTGAIKLWDLRSVNKPVLQFQDTSNPKTRNLHSKKYCSFNVNSSGRFICSGTEVTDGDAFLLFWDTRQAILLGGYWECHTDDITQVCFHPSDENSLVTGSTDGLINLFDIKQNDETEALQQTFNTEASVDKLQWHEGADTTVSCITHTSEVQLWHLDDSTPYNNFSRDDIGSKLQVPDTAQNSGDVYVADVHTTSQPDELMIVAGSKHNIGSCLRSAIMKSGKLNPWSCFDGNKQIVRCSWFDPQKELLVTGGEAGILSVWKPGTSEIITTLNQLKAPSKLKKPQQTKVKPY